MGALANRHSRSPFLEALGSMRHSTLSEAGQRCDVHYCAGRQSDFLCIAKGWCAFQCEAQEQSVVHCNARGEVKPKVEPEGGMIWLDVEGCPQPSKEAEKRL